MTSLSRNRSFKPSFCINFGSKCLAFPNDLIAPFSPASRAIPE
jgi:hypothetical protein